MNDVEIIAALQRERGKRSPVALAQFLDELMDGGLTQGAIVTYFRRAFPSIPLRVLLDAGAWNRVSQGGLSDEDFNALLGPWLK